MKYTNQKNGAVINTDLTREEGIAILTPFKQENDFIRSLVYHATNKSLSPNMTFWFYKMSMDKNPTTVREVVKVGANFGRIKEMFEKAKASGLKRPKLYLQDKEEREVILSLAPETGVNKNHIYLKVNKEYAGKITPEGEFKPVSSCPDGVKEYLEEFAKDPWKMGNEVSKLTGHCCCCGRLLTAENSVSEGIGPICKNRFF